MSRTIEFPVLLNQAREQILAEAEPGAPIEVSLGEALGLVLAEPLLADVDLPPFDRARVDGYAVRASEASVESLLRVDRTPRSLRSDDLAIEAGEAGRVRAGDPMPPGLDAVIRPSEVRPDPDVGPTRVVEVLEAPLPGQEVTPRGTHLSAGSLLADAGTRITPALVPLLASQGCVYPICHRRVRISIVTVGDQWVHPADAPTMNRERNVINATLAALVIRAEAMPHDFGAVSPSKLRETFHRATMAPVVIVTGDRSRSLSQALEAIEFEPVVAGIAVDPIGRSRFGVIRDDDGTVLNHVFHLPADPFAALVGFTLLVEPLLARLRGEPNRDPLSSTIRLADGHSHPATRKRGRAIPALSRVGTDGRWVAEPIRAHADDLMAWSRASGLLVFPDRSGPWIGGDPVGFVSLGPIL